MTNKEKIKEKLKKLFKNKLFLASICLYILIPLLFVFARFSDVSLRTSGTYAFYLDGELQSQISLYKDNKISIESFVEPDMTQPEFKQKQHVVRWTFRSTDWYKRFDPSKYKNLSPDYIAFEDEVSTVRFLFFKVGNKLYSSYLINYNGEEIQKCYVKI